MQVVELRRDAPPLLAVGLNSVEQDALWIGDHNLIRPWLWEKRMKWLYLVTFTQDCFKANPRRLRPVLCNLIGIWLKVCLTSSAAGAAADRVRERHGALLDDWGSLSGIWCATHTLILTVIYHILFTLPSIQSTGRLLLFLRDNIIRVDAHWLNNFMNIGNLRFNLNTKCLFYWSSTVFLSWVIWLFHEKVKLQHLLLINT